jgi:hypothetical protein
MAKNQLDAKAPAEDALVLTDEDENDTAEDRPPITAEAPNPNRIIENTER